MNHSFTNANLHLQYVPSGDTATVELAAYVDGKPVTIPFIMLAGFDGSMQNPARCIAGITDAQTALYLIEALAHLTQTVTQSLLSSVSQAEPDV